MASPAGVRRRAADLYRVSREPWRRGSATAVPGRRQGHRQPRQLPRAGPLLRRRPDLRHRRTTARAQASGRGADQPNGRHQQPAEAVVSDVDVSGASPAAAPPKLDPETLAIRRSEEHTSELQSLMRISYAAFCLKKKKK